VIFCGRAKKVTIRVRANDGTAASVCEALLAFLCPKDVCCLQMSLSESAMEIGFLARPGKVDALTDIASLIAPNALVYAEKTTIVHATTGSGMDLMHERADWESSLRFRNAVAVETKSPGTIGEAQARSRTPQSGKVSSANEGGGRT
jgi:hypothetical protein